MLTSTIVPSISEVPVAVQNESLPSDCEISRRVMQIRASWSLGERVRRRREAERRLSHLLEKLTDDQAA